MGRSASFGTRVIYLGLNQDGIILMQPGSIGLFKVPNTQAVAQTDALNPAFGLVDNTKSAYWIVTASTGKIIAQSLEDSPAPGGPGSRLIRGVLVGAPCYVPFVE
jgi:hypothetical protein